MARPTMTLATAQTRLDAKFPERGLRLTSYTTSERPVTLVCPKHGEVTVSSYSNLMRSAAGCPECGRELKDQSLRVQGQVQSKRFQALNQTHNRLQSLLDRLPELSDPELGAEVRRLLSTSDT